MREVEFLKIMSAMQAAWPRADYSSQSTIKVWAVNINDFDYQSCHMAVTKLIQTSKWPPSIAEVRAAVVDVRLPANKTASEAWGEVKRAIRHFGRNRVEEAMNSLDPVTRNVVKRIGFIEICDSTKISVERGQFLKMYDQEHSRARETAAMSTNLVQSIESMRGESLGLLEGEDEKGKKLLR